MCNSFHAHLLTSNCKFSVLSLSGEHTQFFSIVLHSIHGHSTIGDNQMIDP